MHSWWTCPLILRAGDSSVRSRCSPPTQFTLCKSIYKVLTSFHRSRLVSVHMCGALAQAMAVTQSCEDDPQMKISFPGSDATICHSHSLLRPFWRLKLATTPLHLIPIKVDVAVSSSWLAFVCMCRPYGCLKLLVSSGASSGLHPFSQMAIIHQILCDAPTCHHSFAVRNFKWIVPLCFA